MDSKASQGDATAARPGLGRFAKFATVGAIGVGVNLGVLRLLVEVVHWNPLLAAIVSIEASALSNFFLNRAWTWRDRDRSWWSLLTYHGVSLAGMLGQWFVIFTATTWLGLHYVPAALAGIGLATVWNFVANHFFTFTTYTPQRREAMVRSLMYAGSLVLMLGLAATLSHDWDTFVFQKSVEDFLTDGRTPYQTGVEKPGYVYFGVALPLQAFWYAYPPLPLLLMSVTYAPVALGATAIPWLARVLIKAPFILSMLAVAWFGRRLVLTGPEPTTPVQATRLEAYVLFNPLLLIVAGIWGQFESLIVAFMLLSFLAVRRERWGLAGFLWGAALLVKIFPLYLAPVLAVYLWRRGGFRATFRFFFMGALVFAALSLPFYLLEPGGYLEQVFGMHAGRRPGRFAPVAFAYELLRWVSGRFPGTLPDDAGISRSLSLLSFLLTASLVCLISIASTARQASEKNLAWFAGVSMLAGLLATKVVSEQYMVFPLALLAIARVRMGDAPEYARLRSFLTTAAFFAFAAAFIDSVFFLTYVPEDIALRLFGRPVPEAILAIASFFGITVSLLKVILATVSIVGLLVPFYHALRLVGPVIMEGFRVIAHALHVLARRDMVHWAFRAVAFTFVLFVLVPPAAVGLLTPKRDAAPEDGGVVGPSPLLVRYRADWYNPTNRPDVPGGRWAESALTPESGYYNSEAHKMTEDFVSIRSLHADGVVLPFAPAFEHALMGATDVAAAQGVPYALEVDLARIADLEGAVALTPESADQARELLNGPWFSYWSSPFNLRLTHDGGRVLFLDGTQRVAPTFTDAERKWVAEVALPLVAPAMAAQVTQTTDSDAWRLAPANATQLAAPEAATWRLAYDRAQTLWWERAFAFGDVKTRVDVYVDHDPAIGSVPLGVHRIVGRYAPPTDEAPVANGDAFTWIPARPDEGEAYDDAWIRHAEGPPQGVIIPWNDFDRGQGIEPTVEFGNGLLQRTRLWADVAP